VPVPPGVILQEIKPGNTYFSSAAPPAGYIGTLSSLGGAVSLAANEATNTLYVASVNGTVNVYSLATPAGSPVFGAYGKIKTPQGAAAAGITVSAAGPGGTATAITDAAGQFAPAGLPLGTYTITPVSPSFSFGPASVTVSLIDRNVGGLAFQAARRSSRPVTR